MIYLDTSVLLAHLFAEDRVPPEDLWSQTLVSSRLLEFEVFNRLHARGAAATHGDDARELVDRINLVEMAGPVLGRALLPFAQPVRTAMVTELTEIDVKAPVSDLMPIFNKDFVAIVIT